MAQCPQRIEKMANLAEKKSEGHQTLRVQSDLKARVLGIQSRYYTNTSRKITVTELLKQALDARENAPIGVPKKSGRNNQEYYDLMDEALLCPVEELKKAALVMLTHCRDVARDRARKGGR